MNTAPIGVKSGFWVWLILATFQTSVSGYAAILKGIIRENRAGGPVMAHVAISAAGAGPTVTLSDGQFSLDFPDKRPGDTARLIPVKDGYVVVNDVQMEVVLPTDGSSRETLVILSRPDEREQFAAMYYQLKAFETIEAEYERQLKSLQSSHRADSDQIAALQKERAQKQITADQIAQQVAKSTSIQNSDLYNKALNLYLAGEFDQALGLLNDQALDEDTQSAKRLIVEAEDAADRAVREGFLKADILKSRLDFAGAEKIYANMLGNFPDNVLANNEVAAFYSGLGRFSAALPLYKHAVELATKSKIEDDLGSALNGLGWVYTERSEVDNARDCLQKALAIARNSAARDPEHHDCDVSDNLNNLANLDTSHDPAEAKFKEALQLCRKWVGQYPEIYKIRLARTLMNYGLIDASAGRTDAAYQKHSEALSIYRELAESELDTYGAELAKALSTVAGEDEKYFHRAALARNEIEEAVKILRKLVQDNPEASLPGLAADLSTLAELDHDEKRDSDAQKAISESVRIYRELVVTEPDSYLSELSDSLSSMAEMTDDDGEAERDNAEAAGIMRDLIKKNARHRLRFVEVLNSAAVCDRDHGRVGIARQEYAEQESILRALEREQPGQYRREIAIMLMNEGYLEHDRGRMNIARGKYSEALQITRQLVAEHQEDVRPVLADLLYDQATLDRDVRKLSNALEEATESVAIFEDLAAKDPRRFAPSLKVTKTLRDGLGRRPTTPTPENPR